MSFSKRGQKLRRVNYIHLIFKLIPLKLFLDHSWPQKSQQGLKKCQSCDERFTHVDSCGGFKAFVSSTGTTTRRASNIIHRRNGYYI